MGTPQMRWREMHQSGRVATMLVMRSWPQAGSQVTRLISSRARWRNGWFEAGSALRSGRNDRSGQQCDSGMGVSMLMNHCSVARVMTGLWQRQQCG